MHPYIVVITWRRMSWTIRAWAHHPADLFALLENFGPAPAEMKVAPAFKR